MTLPNSGISRQGTQTDNPYSNESQYVSETIEVAKSIVTICSQTAAPSDDVLTTLNSCLDRLYMLVSPDDDADATTKSSGISKQGQPDGASYDSSMAGIAANSMLSQFADTSQGQNKTTNLAVLLANTLAQILINSTTRALQMKAALALIQLAAKEPPPPLASAFDQDQFSPYGHPQNMSPSSAVVHDIPTSWCYVLVNSNALSALVQQLPSPTSSANNNAIDIELCEKCAWAIANLAGDSIMAREALQNMGALSKLTACISLGTSAQPNLAQQGNYQSMAGILRNALWALTNLLREGGMLLLEFVKELLCSTANSESRSTARLTPRDIAILLSSRELFPYPPSNSTTWEDVLDETCWFVSFLTRDPVSVDILCADEQSGNGNTVSMLVTRLVEAKKALMGQQNAGMKCMIPCCRALKNIAIASNGKYVSSILLTLANGNDIGNGQPVRLLEGALAELIGYGTLGAGSEASTIASEAASTAGALLYNAGFPLPHPATQSCRVLLPALCQALISDLTTFNFRREVVWALWNAVNLPPDLNSLEYEEGRCPDVAVQNMFLVEIICTNPTKIAWALESTLLTQNSDTIEASLYLIRLLLQRLDTDNRLANAQFSGKKLSTVFEEAGLVDALWRICDNDSDESATAELAAEIIDEFYEEEEVDDDNEMFQPATVGGHFQFQAAGMTLPEGGFNFGAPAVVRQEQHLPPAGRGRGRGQVVPAWMQKQT